MGALAAEIVLWLVLAATIGLAAGWLLWGWWAQRAPANLPTEDEVRQLRQDLAAARQEAAELRALVGSLGERARRPRLGAAGPVSHFDERDPAAPVIDLRARPQAATGVEEALRLQAISGIGPKLERDLRRFGVHTLEQLAELDDEAVDALDAALGEFRGRMRRDDWVGQARRLLGPSR